ncbi:MAG: hypothetical protein LH679_12720 [Cyanobacteria bacterium CAN_BIN43]|nr:hypothetical protein [Cyanobacteria bacterium CAN_BIN43]
MTREGLKCGNLQKKSARFLAELPPEHLFVLANTTDQFNHWDDLRWFYAALSACWQAIHSAQDDPLAPLLESGEINTVFYNYIWLTVDCYGRLWELIQISFRYVRLELLKHYTSCAPQSAHELFKKIVSDFSKEQFDICLKDYVKVSGRKLLELQELGLKVFKEENLSPYEKVRLQRLLTKDWDKKALITNPAFVILLDTCYKKVNGRNTALKARLEAYHIASFNLLEQEKKLHWHTGSWTWDKGKRISSKLGGNYARN